MLRRVRFVSIYFFFWVVNFQIARLIFLAYQWRSASVRPVALLAGIPVHGLIMDLSAAAVVTVLPAMVVSRAGFIPPPSARRIISWYTTGLLLIAAIGTVADLELFASWGTRLDATPLFYLATPREAFASSGSSPLFLLILAAIALVLAGTAAFRRLVLPWFDMTPSRSWVESLGILCISLILVVPIRGGVYSFPVNQSSVYFSHDPFANEAAINPLWNFAASLIDPDPNSDGYRFTDDTSARQIADSLLRSPPEGKAGDRPMPLLLRQNRPNVVFIVWEGLTARFVDPLGTRHGITPNLTRLAHEGVLFDGLYASGNRTPIGLAALLSGFPSPPKSPVIESAVRSAALPNLSHTFKRAGYHTSFYYGGEFEFANIKRYLIDAQFDVLVGKVDFNRTDWTSQWGVHDHILLARVLRDLGQAPAPFFSVVLTQSSHEPFDVPMPTVIPGSGRDQRFLNSQLYTDRSVGEFIERAKRTSWWDNTLVVIIADHGRSYASGPGESFMSPEQFRIPMLWVGGALAVRDTVVRRIASQTDLSRTLLAQLALPAGEFRWGKNFLAPGTTEFAYYTFNEGFGYVDAEASFVFDDVSRSVVEERGKMSPGALRAGRCFQQVMLSAYHNLARVQSFSRDPVQGARAPAKPL